MERIDTMHTLIYLSSASHLYSELDLIKILSKSRENNSRLDITGLLLYNEGSILQILEGDRDVIHNLFGTISKDARHKSIIKLIDSVITERSFRDWSMGFKQISDMQWQELEGHLDLDNRSTLNEIVQAGSKSVVSLIKSFALVTSLPMP